MMSLKCVLIASWCLSVRYVPHVNFQKGVVAGFHYLIRVCVKLCVYKVAKYICI